MPSLPAPRPRPQPPPGPAAVTSRTVPLPAARALIRRARVAYVRTPLGIFRMVKADALRTLTGPAPSAVRVDALLDTVCLHAVEA
jgi:hypothetical protein